jgi:hypothetical protein
MVIGVFEWKSFSMREILTHILRPLVELQEEFGLTGNENQETRSVNQKKLNKLSMISVRII